MSVQDDEAKSMGTLRQDAHKNNTTPRFFDDPTEENTIGVYGEIEFAKEFGLDYDKTARPKGDRGVDFPTKIGTINVKTARKPIFLFVKKFEPKADIYVLAAIDWVTKKVTFLGWEWDSVMRAMPTKDFGYGIVNHYKRAALLKSMNELRAMLTSSQPTPNLAPANQTIQPSDFTTGSHQNVLDAFWSKSIS